MVSWETRLKRFLDFQFEYRELLLVALISLSFLGAALSNLGFRDVPVTNFTPIIGDVIVIELAGTNYVNSVLILVKNGVGNIIVHAETVSGQTASVSSTIEGYYNWETIPIQTQANRVILFVEATSVELTEICVVGASNEKIRVVSIHDVINSTGGVERLVDEQDKVRLPITAESETYFDEVYFVRAAEDYLNGRAPYENTHPPLGKEIIAAGIILAGYSPFGWRILGVLFGTMMLPLVYFFGCELSDSRRVGLLSSLLLSLDFMHFTYARIATVDTFVTFFVLLSWFFFMRFYKLRRGESPQRFVSLALWAFSAGLAFSTKWYALFALFGQIFLVILPIVIPDKGSESRVKIRFKLSLKEALLGIAISLGVYFFTYLPQIVTGSTLGDIVVQQFQMFTYHSTLSAMHPFASPWFSWPIILRPLWLYVSNPSPGTVSTIVAMGNPAVWWVGLGGVVFSAYRYLRRRAGVDLIVLVVFVSQLLPYALMTRPLFIYHYFMEVPILCVSIPLLFEGSWRDNSSKCIATAIVLAALILFVVFYPAISGSPTSSQDIISLRWFNSWVF